MLQLSKKQNAFTEIAPEPLNPRQRPRKKTPSKTKRKSLQLTILDNLPWIWICMHSSWLYIVGGTPLKYGVQVMHTTFSVKL